MVHYNNPLIKRYAISVTAIYFHWYLYHALVVQRKLWQSLRAVHGLQQRTQRTPVGQTTLSEQI